MTWGSTVQGCSTVLLHLLQQRSNARDAGTPAAYVHAACTAQLEAAIVQCTPTTSCPCQAQPQVLCQAAAKGISVNRYAQASTFKPNWQARDSPAPTVRRSGECLVPRLGHMQRTSLKNLASSMESECVLIANSQTLMTWRCRMRAHITIHHMEHHCICLCCIARVGGCLTGQHGSSPGTSLGAPPPLPAQWQPGSQALQLQPSSSCQLLTPPLRASRCGNFRQLARQTLRYVVRLWRHL